jgi:hypothetical protein
MKRKKSPSRTNGRGERRLVGFDAAGHIDPAEANRLLELGRSTRLDESNQAFEGATEDDLAEELGEAAVHHMTTGADELTSDLEAEVEEELGGPFVVTSANTEFAGGTDESNIETATREPFPTT